MKNRLMASSGFSKKTVASLTGDFEPISVGNGINNGFCQIPLEMHAPPGPFPDFIREGCSECKSSIPGRHMITDQGKCVVVVMNGNRMLP